ADIFSDETKQGGRDCRLLSWHDILLEFKVVRLMRYLRFLVVFGVLSLGFGPAAASKEAAALRLPVDEFPLIPGDAGMRFFEGTWQPLGRNSYGLTKTVTVTDKTVSWDDIDDVTPYRVLAERENYVLLASYDRVSVVRYEYWTQYVILHLRYLGGAKDAPPSSADMIYLSCSDHRLRNGPPDFKLSRATLLGLFATSYCRKEIGATESPTNLWIADNRWNRQPFARITSANKGKGWIRMRRNEKILGLPQGTVPEPKY
ncbi:hypothetical protein JYU08_00165, partial [bacterium AH-315-B06]|nr:hypothetical protein [bacterium AH-315-B06]